MNGNDYHNRERRGAVPCAPRLDGLDESRPHKLRESVFRFIIPPVIAVILCASSLGSAGEPPVSVAVSVDKNEITIGDVVTLTLTVRYPKGVEVSVPPLGDKLGEFLIRDISQPKPRTRKNMTVREIRYLITTYIVGDVAVPPVEVGYSYQDKAGKKIEKKIKTDPVSIHVKRVAPKDATDIRDIKGPVELPFNWRPYLLWGGTALAALGLAIFGVLYFKKLRPAAVERARLTPPVPPHERALADLERIEAMGLIEEGRFDLFYDLVTDTLRAYLGARYNFNAIDMTTGEVIDALDGRLRRLDLKDSVAEMLRESDFVKFARGESDAERAGRLIEQARNIVRSTTPAGGIPVAAEA